MCVHTFLLSYLLTYLLKYIHTYICTYTILAYIHAINLVKTGVDWYPQQTHYPDTTEEVLYAVRDIRKGEEINDCYIDLRQPKIKRQAELREYYRFDCLCAGCSLPTAKDSPRYSNTAGHDYIHMYSYTHSDDFGLFICQYDIRWC